MNYYTKMYIKYKESEILLNVGYKGKPVKIIKKLIKNKEFRFEEKNEGFAKKENLILRNCSNCNFSCENKDQFEKHIVENRHEELQMIRNSIKFFIPNYFLKLENVSCYNRQPARIFFSTRYKYYDKYSGIIVNRDWKDRSKIMHIFDTSPIDSKNMENDIGYYSII